MPVRRVEAFCEQCGSRPALADSVCGFCATLNRAFPLAAVRDRIPDRWGPVRELSRSEFHDAVYEWLERDAA